MKNNSQLALINRALKDGQPDDWISERINGIEARKELTAALKQAVEYIDPKGIKSSFIEKPKPAKPGKPEKTPVTCFIEAETNLIYSKLGISREERKAIKKGVKRNHFNATQLNAVCLAEQHNARIWATCVKQQWTRDKAKQARTEMLNRLASVQQLMKELTGETA